MSAKVHIVDYGLGNLYSVARAVEACGGEPVLATTAAEVRAADRLILPGVGAFENGMSGLRSAGQEDAVREFAATGRPLLGICLGMQMLASRSLEFGQTAGLDLIPGDVVPIPREGADGAPHKIPFVGWVPLQPSRAERMAGTILESFEQGDYVYLVHSFHFVPQAADDLLASYDYDGVEIAAAVARDNIIGCQFHPEKSSMAGLKVINSFLGR